MFVQQLAQYQMLSHAVVAERKVKLTDVPHLEEVGPSIEDVHDMLPKQVIR